MPAQPGLPSTSTYRTTFLLSNLHCSTCTSFIESLLLGLDPPPVSVEASTINQSVTVKHTLGFDLYGVSRVLADSGYEVVDVVSDHAQAEDNLRRDVVAGSPDDDFPLSWLGHGTKAADNIRKRHAEHCVQCREEAAQSAAEQGRPTPSAHPQQSEPAAEVPFVVIGSPDLPTAHQTFITIEGMSCSSCIGKITEALESKPWVKAANVGLLTRTATVDFLGDHDAMELVKTIDGLGYTATLEEVLEHPGMSAGPKPTDDVWQASLSIGGMTCSSCVGTITKALEKLPWIKFIDVNLVSSSATAVFVDKNHLNDIISAVGELGYEASLNDVVNVNKPRDKDTRRSLALRVDGMYCRHCPDRVLQAVKGFGERLVLDKAPTLEWPFVNVSYIPQAPDFTVRDIVSTISAVDQAFTVTIYHPPTVEERSRQMLRRTRRRIFYRVLLSFFAAMPALVIGVVYMSLVSSDNPGKQYLMEPLGGVSRAEWSLLVIATPVYFFAADIFHRRTIKELYNLWKPGSPVPLLRRLYRFGSMDMLLSFATTIAYLGSIAEIIIAATLREDSHLTSKAAYLDAVVFLTLFLLVGRLIEAYTKAKTGEAVTKLGSLRPKEAFLLVSGREHPNAAQMLPTNIDMLDSGDLVRIVHGASPPWDGILVEGDGEFLESSLTGESRPIQKWLGDPLYSGTINKGGPVTMRITGAPGQSLLDQIIKVVREGQARRAPIERVADAITGYFVPIVTLIAIVTWLTWLGLGESGRLPEDYMDAAVGGWPFWSLQFAIAVFVIACPCGIGLAAPTALFVGGGLAAEHGILAKGGGEAFQEASRLDIIVFDKTGTLTEGGEPKITNHQFFAAGNSTWTERTILGVIGELEGDSTHPIAKALVTFCASRDAEAIKPKQAREVPGKGIRGTFEIPSSSYPIETIVGNEALMADFAVAFDPATIAELDSWKDQAKSVVLVAGRQVTPNGDCPWIPLATFAVSDPLRLEARPCLDALRRQGVDVWMISGDNAKTANAVGAMVGIPSDRIIAGVLPERKAEKIQHLQKSQIKLKPAFLGLKSTSRRPVVAMVGDGINDSPALTMADVGIAIGSGSDVAISAAEFVLVNSSLTTILTLTSLSRAVFRRVKFNFAWALVYNVVALPVAAGVLYPIKTNGVYTRLDPVWAALAMALSSVSVITSSLLLRTRLPLVGYRYARPKDFDVN